MAVPEIVKATVEHARALAPRMRATDVAEVEASGGYSPLGALVVSIRASTETYTWLISGQVGAIFGIVACGREGEGVIWLLTSDLVDKHPREFVKTVRVVLADFLERWEVLWNRVSESNGRALHWAARAGFEVGAPCTYGILGLPFRTIALRRAGG